MKKLIFMIACGCALLACRSSPDTAAEIPPGFKTDKIVANATHLESLVSKNEIADLIGIDANEIKQYQKNFDDDIATAVLLFTWQNGNVVSVKVNGQERKLNGSSSIGIGRLMKLNKAEFEQMYRAKTKEEIAVEINQIVQDKEVDADIAIYEAKEIARRAKTLSYQKLEHVGTAAYWETPLNVLHVLANDVAFSISTNLQEDETESKRRAIALANLIFKKSTI
ncbi:MAG: hypothetical protein ACQUHE_11850 [Bacteroidia bacterium]